MFYISSPSFQLLPVNKSNFNFNAETTLCFSIEISACLYHNGRLIKSDAKVWEVYGLQEIWFIDQGTAIIPVFFVFLFLFSFLHASEYWHLMLWVVFSLRNPLISAVQRQLHLRPFHWAFNSVGGISMINALFTILRAPKEFMERRVH